MNKKDAKQKLRGRSPSRRKSLKNEIHSPHGQALLKERPTQTHGNATRASSRRGMKQSKESSCPTGLEREQRHLRPVTQTSSEKRYGSDQRKGLYAPWATSTKRSTAHRFTPTTRSGELSSTSSSKPHPRRRNFPPTSSNPSHSYRHPPHRPHPSPYYSSCFPVHETSHPSPSQ